MLTGEYDGDLIIGLPTANGMGLKMKDVGDYCGNYRSIHNRVAHEQGFRIYEQSIIGFQGLFSRGKRPKTWAQRKEGDGGTHLRDRNEQITVTMGNDGTDIQRQEGRGVSQDAGETSLSKKGSWY